MQENRQKRLERLFHSNNWTDDDRNWLKDYIDNTNLAELQLIALDEFNSDLLNGKSLLEEKLSIEILNNIHNHIGNELPNKRKKLLFTIAAAASIILCLSIGSYFIFHKQVPLQYAFTQKSDILPGGNKAILILADGKKIFLTDANNGLLAKQEDALIRKTKDGEVVYTAGQSESSNQKHALLYNTISTPKTGKYDIVLPDGTKVSLDAVSSIRFPASFSSKERKVEITGQVYFEVAHDKTKPFRVTARGVTVEVLGTHFNINAYDDESTIKTTLLEGLIKISASGQTGLLKPGQQAQIGSTDSKIKIINEVDVEQVVDWMNGDFIFNGEDIYTTMRKISRWYDVDVVYQGSSKNLQLEGRVSRSKNISIVLKAMELTGKIHFKLEGRRITVMP